MTRNQGCDHKGEGGGGGGVALLLIADYTTIKEWVNNKITKPESLCSVVSTCITQKPSSRLRMLSYGARFLDCALSVTSRPIAELVGHVPLSLHRGRRELSIGQRVQRSPAYLAATSPRCLLKRINPVGGHSKRRY